VWLIECIAAEFMYKNGFLLKKAGGLEKSGFGKSEFINLNIGGRPVKRKIQVSLALTTI